jgi:integrase
MGVNIREKRGKLYLDVYFNGRRTWESTGLTISTDSRQNKEVMKLAEVLRSKRETQIVSGEWGLLDPLSGKKSLYSYMQEMGSVRDSKDKINKCLRYLEQYPGGAVVQIAQINERWVESFQNYLLKDTGLSQTTAHNYAAAIRFALNKAVRENIIARNPAAAVRGINLPESEKVYLNTDEIQRLANTEINGNLGAEVRKAFLFCCFTGLRISDIKTLTWGDIERDPLQIKKRQHKTGRYVYIPLNNNAWELINEGSIHKHTELVFPLIGNTNTNTNQYMAAWTQGAGVDKKIGWHTARHTFATLTLENGADFFTVSKLLGHTKTSTTAVYTKATDKLKREAVNALPQIDIPAAGGVK